MLEMKPEVLDKVDFESQSLGALAHLFMQDIENKSGIK